MPPRGGATFKEASKAPVVSTGTRSITNNITQQQRDVYINQYDSSILPRIQGIELALQNTISHNTNQTDRTYDSILNSITSVSNSITEEGILNQTSLKTPRISNGTLSGTTIIGLVESPGTLTINEPTTLNNNTEITGSNTFKVGTGLTTLGGDLTVTGTNWTTTPTISGLITATSGLTSNGTVTVQNNSNFIQSGSGSFSTGTGAVSLNGPTTISGQTTLTHIPTLAHIFSTWPTGTSNVSDSTIYINPSSSIANGNLIGASVAGVAKFIVDAEGNIYGNSVILTGSVTSGSTNVASLSVLDNTTLGDAGTDTVTIHGAVTLDNSFSQTGANTFSTGTGLATLGGGLNVVGNVGIGITNPSAYLNIKAGTATAGTAPIKLTSGTLTTTPEVGALEFNNDAYYGTVTTLAIGDSYGGGVIVYILQAGDPGYVAGYQKGLIAATSDQSSGTNWGCDMTTISGADGTAIGTGEQNTISIMNGCATAGIAARLSGDLVLNGYSDWYLPSKDELNQVYINRAYLGDFNSTYYWTSSQIGQQSAWGQRFDTGEQGSWFGGKTFPHAVRSVRSFSVVTRGQFAFTSDMANLYVPYTGGTTNVDLGIHNLTVDTNSLFVDSVNHKVGIGTTVPTNLLSLSGTSSRTIWMERNTTLATAGQGLTLSSGGAITGTNNLAGGDLNLKSGISTGTGTSALHFFTATAGSSGATDNTPTEKMTILGNGNVGIGTTNPRTAFEVAGNADGAILATGTYGSGWTEPNLGAGARMLWYPQKAAFRAGYVDGTQWNNASIGNYSTATGYKTTASGDSSTAMGVGTTASGSYSIAMGVNSTASGGYSIAMGRAITASGSYSIAMGDSTRASGQDSTAMGEAATASGNYSTAMGYNTTASGVNSTSMGDYTTASGYDSFAIGRYNVGGGTAGSWVATDSLFEIGNGTGTGVNASNALTVLKNGNVGIGTTAPGNKLEVNGSARIAGDGVLQFTDTPANNQRGKIYYDSGTGQFRLDSNSSIPIGIGSGYNANILLAMGGGNVGVGTTGPGFKLDVSGADSNGRIARFLSSNGAGGTIQISAGGTAWDIGPGTRDMNNVNDFGIYDGTASRLVIKSGNVGIGIIDPQAILHVNNSGANTTALMISSGAQLASNSGPKMIYRNGSTDVAFVKGAYQTDGNPNYGILTFGTLSYTDGVTEKMRIDGVSGNVGIGMTGPSYKLDVAGALRATLASSAIIIANYDANNRMEMSANGFNLVGENDFTIQQAGGTAQVTINHTSGNVGIGTTAPDHLLTLSSPTSNKTVLGLYNTDGTAGNRNWAIQTNRQVYGDFQIQQSDALGGNPITAGTTRFYIRNDGNIGIGTTSPESKLHIVGPFYEPAATQGTLSILTVESNDAPGANVGATIAMKGRTGNLTDVYSFGNIKAAKEGAAADGGYASYMAFYTSASNSAVTEKMRIASSGNVGIGTTAPTEPLTITSGSDAISLNGGIGAAQRFIQSTGWNGTENYFGIRGVSGKYFSLGGATGNVGIGTTAPSRKLVIQGSSVSNDQLLYLKQGDDNGYSFNIDSATTGKMMIKGVNSGVESNIMTMDRSTGNVGIGTTGPGENLSVAGSTSSGSISLIPGTGTYAGYKLLLTAQAADEGMFMSMGGTKIMSAYGYNDANEVGFGNLSHANLLYLNSSGNVGIGTTGPNAKLDVNGNINFAGGSNGNLTADNNTALSIVSGSGSNTRSGIAIKDSWNGTNNNNGYVSLFVGNGSGNTEGLRVINNGNVGIGTASPAVRFQVTPSVNSSPMTLGTAGGSFALTSANSLYGLFSGIMSEGPAWLQVGRIDGQTSTYALSLQPSGGYVGINTYAPNAALGLANGGTIGWGNSNSYTWGIQKLTNDLHIKYTSGNDPSAGTDAMTFLGSNGNVGIGATNPGTKLEVAGVVTATGGNSTQWNAAYSSVIGGKNYIANTGNPALSVDGWGVAGWTGNKTISVAENALSFSVDNGWRSFYYPTGLANTKITISFDAKWQQRQGVEPFGVGTGNSTYYGTWEGTVNVGSGSYTKNSFTYTTGADGYVNFTFQDIGVGSGLTDIVLIRNLKVEIGDKATDWTPALTEYVRTNVFGSVGIGTTNPEFTLDVNGDIAFPRTNKLMFAGPTVGDRSRSYLTGDGNNDIFVYGPSSNIITTFGYTGNVGISTTNPQTQLHLGTETPALSIGAITSYGGSSGNAMAAITSTLGLGDYGGSLNFQTNSWGSSSYGYAYTPTTKMVINAPGNVGIGTTNPGTYKLYINGTGYLNTSAWVYGSDRRLKENISYLPDDGGLEKILALKPAKFDYIAGEKGQIGFIAQEVQEVIPEAVVITNPTTGMLGLKTEFITPYLVKAIQELNLKLEGINKFEVDGAGKVIANTLRDNLTAWLSNAGNKITRIFTGEVCLTDPGQEAVCINRTELQSLKAMVNNPPSCVAPSTIVNGICTAPVVGETPTTILAAAKATANAKAQADYTSESWTTFQTALTTALGLPEVTDTNKTDMTTAINTAIAGLAPTCASPSTIVNGVCTAPVATDISALTTAKTTAGGLITASAIESVLPGEHIVGSLAALITANAAANGTTSDTQAVINAQVSALNTAITAYNAAIVPAVPAPQEGN